MKIGWSPNPVSRTALAIWVAFDKEDNEDSPDYLCTLALPAVPRVGETVVLPPSVGIIGKVVKVMWFTDLTRACDAVVILRE